jgi:hypothetical protein
MQIRWFKRENLLSELVSGLHSVDVVLDLGPGINPQSFVRANLYIWCEPCPEYVEFLQKHNNGSPNVVILKATAQEVVPMMPDRSVDTILLIDVLEHLDRESGQQLLNHCIRLARKQIVVFTPMGFLPQEYEEGSSDSWGMSGAKWQMHRSGWMPEDFDDSWEILACADYHQKNGAGELLEPPFGAFYAVHHQGSGAALSHIVALVAPELPPMTTPAASAVSNITHSLTAREYYVISAQQQSPFESIEIHGRVFPRSYYHLRARMRPELFVDERFPDLIDELELAVFNRLYNMTSPGLFEVSQLVSNRLMETRHPVPIFTKLLETLDPARQACSRLRMHIGDATGEASPTFIPPDGLLDSAALKDVIESVCSTVSELVRYRTQAEEHWIQAANIGYLSAGLFELFDRAHQIQQVLQKDKAVALFAFLGGDPYYLPASCLASRWTGTPLIPCITSHWIDCWPASRRAFASTLENCILKASAAILVPDAKIEKEFFARVTCPIYRLDADPERWIGLVRALTLS